MCWIASMSFTIQAGPDDWPVSGPWPLDDIRIGSVSGGLPCYGSVQLSLDQTGKALITPAMIISDKLPSYAKFKAVILETGKNYADCSDIGLSRSVKVTDTTTDNSCWAILKVEDKLKPNVQCANDTFLCSIDPFSVNYEKLVSATDNCDINPTIRYDLSYQKRSCDPFFSGVMHVDYTVIDDYMNSSLCSKDVYFKKIPLDSIVFPPDDTIYCQLGLQDSGEPNFHGQPVTPMCDMVSSHKDDTIIVCGGMYKIVRLWVVMDWCLRSNRMYRQEILVADTTRPHINCPADVTLITSGSSCTVNYTIPRVLADDDCSPSDQLVYYVRVDNAYLSTPGKVILLVPGDHLMQYIAIDPCGNADTCVSHVVVEDRSAPNIVCPPSLILSLGANGIVNLNLAYLSKFVYYSDNCGIDTVLIRRMTNQCGRPMDTTFRDEIQFCCNDLGRTEMIVLKVVDTYGNANICMIQIIIQNKNLSLINCPSNITVNCTKDIYNLKNTGEPIINNICSSLGTNITYRDSNVLDSCKTGVIKRKFIIYLSNGGVDSTCSQYISVRNPMVTPIISWPKDTILPACVNNHPDSIKSKPFVFNDSCNVIKFTYKDSMPVAPPDSCMKIFRQWKSVATCGYASFSNTQMLTLKDFNAPKLKGPKDTFHCVDDTICNPFIVLQPLQITGCNVIKSVVNSYNNGGANASGIYPLGRYEVIFTVTDGCNHVAKDTVIVEVVDKIAPVIGCRTVKRDIQINDSAKVTARDLLLPSYHDNCTPGNMLSISFSVNDPNDTCRYLPCSQHKKFPDSLWPFNVFVKDKSGNLAQCMARLDVDDPNGFCNNLTGDKVSVSGLISAPGKRMLNDVIVNDMMSHAYSMSNSEGKFEIHGIRSGDKVVLQPSGSSDWLENISTQDIIRIQKHILGVDLFTDPLEWIAADVNRDGYISTIDITLLRKLMLGKISEIPGNTSWRFIPAGYAFSDLEYPLHESLPENVSKGPVTSDLTVDFTGVKVGDVSGIKGIQSSQLNSRVRYYSLRTQDAQLFEGYRHISSFFAEQELTFEGLQLRIHFNPEIAVPDRIIVFNRNPEGEALGEDQFSVRDNELFISYQVDFPQRIQSGEKVMAIIWKDVNKSLFSELITETAFDGNEIYTSGYAAYPLVVHMQPVQGRNEIPEIDDFRQAPNPFSESCVFQFQSNSEVDTYLELIGSDGKVIISRWSPAHLGINRIQIQAEQLSGAGIYHYKFVVGDYLKKGKIVLSR